MTVFEKKNVFIDNYFIRRKNSRALPIETTKTLNDHFTLTNDAQWARKIVLTNEID